MKRNETIEKAVNVAVDIAFNSARQLIHKQTIARIDAILADCRRRDAKREKQRSQSWKI